MSDNDSRRFSRRDMIKATGAVAGSTVVAGCGSGDGGDGGDGSSGDGGSDGGDDSTPTPEPTPTATATPESLELSHTDVASDFATTPYVVAVREFLPEVSDGRYSGDVRYVQGGGSLTVQLMLSGETQVYATGTTTLYQGIAAGNDFSIVAPKLKGTDYVIVGRSNVDSMQAFAENSDLRFGISTPGGLSHAQPIGVFIEEDINYENINFVRIGGSSQRTQAVAAGQIDGAALHAGQFEQLQSEGVDVQLLATVREYFPEFVQENISFLPQGLEQESYQDYATHLCLAMLQSYERARNDFEWIYEKAQQYQAAPLDREQARSSWELSKEINSWDLSSFGESGFIAVEDMMVGSGGIPEEINVEELIDRTHLENAREMM